MSSRAKRADRTKKRMTCAIWIDQTRHSGIVLDVSATGLFIQTSASPSPGTSIAVELGVHGTSEPIRLEGRVARKTMVPPRLATVAPRGIGVQIEHAPEGYYALLSKIQRDVAAAPVPSGAAEARRFRVRLRQIPGSRSRALDITAASEEDARCKAVAELGEGWQVLACEPVTS